MVIKKLVLGSLQTNCYFVIENNKCLVIDCACDAEKILDFAKSLNVKIEGVLLTHGHYDHCSGAKELQRQGVKIYLSKFDSDVVENKNKFYFLSDENKFKTDVFVNNNDELNLIGLKIKVVETSGHTKGSVSYLIENNLFCGDTIFACGIGRYDLYSGSFQDLKNSIKKVLLLPNNTKLFPGHGSETNIENEIKYLENILKLH